MTSELERRCMAAIYASYTMTPKKAQDRLDKQQSPVFVAAVLCYVLSQQCEEDAAPSIFTLERLNLTGL